jgi:hypothetical protein
MIRAIIEAFSRLIAVFHKRKLDEEFGVELDAHIELLTEENQRRGMSAIEARRQAIWRIGGVDAARELQREARGLPRLENVIRAFSQAWRSWRSAKMVAVFAVVALAVGIGATTSIYTVVRAVMLKPLPYRDGDRYVALFGANTNDPEHYGDLSDKAAHTYQERTRVFDAFGWFREAGKNLVYAGEPQHIEGVAVTTSLVYQLGANPAVGRWFQDPNEVVISNSLWRRLGGNPGIIGKPLTLDGHSYTVIGVMPAAFHLPMPGPIAIGSRTDVWIPLDPKESGGGFFAYARRKPGVSFSAAESDVKRVAAEYAAEDPVRRAGYSVRFARCSRRCNPLQPPNLAPALRRRVVVIPDHLREHGRVVAGAIGRARPGNGDSGGVGTRAWPPGSALFCRGIHGRSRRRRRRCIAECDVDARNCFDGVRIPSAGRGDHAGLDGSRLRSGRSLRCERALQSRPALAGRENITGRYPYRGRAGIRQCPDAPGIPVAGHHRDRAGFWSSSGECRAIGSSRKSFPNGAWL